MPRSSRRKHVVLAFPVSVPHLAMSFRGIADYAQEHGGWDFITSPPTLRGSEEQALNAYCLVGQPVDGIIAMTGDLAEARYLRRLKIPAVNITSIIDDKFTPQVVVNNYEIGRLGAEHLLHCGLKHLAFYGFSGPWYSSERQRGFVERARESGIPCDVFTMAPCSNPRDSWKKRFSPLLDWLKKLELPVGIMAVHDYRARALIDACLQLGLNVPRDVAVLGVDNDPIVCEYCRPTISSISRNGWEVGYQAATLLDRLMAGKSPPKTTISVSPEGVVARRSTDVIAVDDPGLNAALHFLHDHFSDPLTINQIVHHAGVSRRQLERQFQHLLCCTPYEYLCRLRIERAKQLLSGSESTKMHTIARECGFPSPLRMRLTFQRLTGMSPQQYRQKNNHLHS